MTDSRRFKGTLVAEVRLFPPQEGGMSFDPGRGIHSVGLLVDGVHSSGLILLEKEMVRGTRVDLEICLLAKKEILPLLPVGKEFELWAGKVIGRGKVLNHLVR